MDDTSALLAMLKDDKESDLLRDLFEYGILLDERKIHLFGEISQTNADWLLRAIQYFNSVGNDKPIEVYICSEGGDVHAGLAMYDIIKYVSKAPIITIGTGLIASAAVLPLIAGHSRLVTPSAWFMFHQQSLSVDGTQDATTSFVDAGKKVWKVFCQLLEKHSKKTSRYWQQVARRKAELWLDAEGMVAHGIIDGIVE